MSNARQFTSWPRAKQLMMRYCITACLTGLCMLGGAPSARATSLGLNAGGIVDWSPGLMFADTVKMCRGWGTIGSEGLDNAPKDGNGWPTVDAGTILNIDTGVDISGTYGLSFVGSATTVVTALDSYASSFTVTAGAPDGNGVRSGTIVVPSGARSMWIKFTGTTGGVKNVKVMRPTSPGATTSFPTTQLFTQQYLNCFQYFSSIRAMDLHNTNGNADVNWTDRRLPGNSYQTDGGGAEPGKEGIAWEYIIALANATGKDIWINVPGKATDTYVTNMANLVKYGSDGVNPYTSTQGSPVYAPLNSGLHVYVEYANEVWNQSGAFQISHNYNNAQAAIDGIDDKQEYGKRSAQIANDFKAVFGSLNGTVKIVCCWQQDWNPPGPNFDEMLQYINDHFGVPNTLVWAICSGDYYRDCLNGAPGASDSIATLLANMNTNIAANDSLFTSIYTTSTKWGVKYDIYEGGPDSSVGGSTNMATRDAAQRDAGMTAIIESAVNPHFWGKGGDMYMFFSDISGYGQYGSWGLSETVYNQNTPKWQGIYGLAGASIPSAPTGLTATGGNSQVALSWNASSGATSYNILRSTVSGGGYASVATGVATTSYTNTGLTNGSNYFFVVTATNSAGTSGNSNEASAMPTSGNTSGPVKINCGGPAAAPFIADADFSGGTAFTNWTGAIDTSAVTNPAPQAVYQPERYGALTYTVGGLTANTNYTVRLHFCENYFTVSGGRVFNVSINGTPVLTNFDIYATAGAIHKANIQQFTVAANGSGQEVIVLTNVTNNALVNGIEVNAAAVPPVPTGLTATPGNAQVALSWTASSGATNYNVKRSTVSGSGYAQVATVSATNYTNTGLTNGTAYYFVVSALNSSGESANSAQASATPIAPPAAPTGLTATAGNSQVALSWTASTGATNYNVKRSTVSGSGYAQVITVSTTSYTNTGLTNGTAYYFIVTALNAGGESANSAQASATPIAGTSGPVKINCGGPAASPFIADADFSGGTAFTNWTGTIDTSAVTNPAPQAVYQPERYGAMTYTIGGLTANANYTVRLHFCENYFTVSGGRVFNVSINGTPVLTNFDIYAAAGAIHKANIQQLTAAANGSGQEVIVFTNVTNNALVNGIEVNTIAIPPVPTGLTATPGNAQVALSWSASSGATAYDVKRSTVSGSGYVTVSSPTTTSYTNTGLTNGTTYYFVVDAKNAGGTSANSSQVSATPVGDTAQYSFESGVQGWTFLAAPATGVAASTTQKFAGAQSLACTINGAAGTSQFYIRNPTTPAGAVITFHVWIPSGSQITFVQPYVQQPAAGGWTFTADYVPIANLTTNAWNTFTVTVPSNAVTPVDTLGVQIGTGATWSGTCYVDTVSW